MSTKIDDAFLKQFEQEIKVAYQLDYGSKLVNTTRKKQVTGNSMYATFGQANLRYDVNRHSPGQAVSSEAVSFMSEELKKTCAGIWAGPNILNESMERTAIVESIANCLGINTDKSIINKLATAINAVNTSGSGLITESSVMQAIDKLTDIPNDRNLFGAVSWKQWGALLSIDSFAKSPNTSHPSLGNSIYVKDWMNVTWFVHKDIDANKAFIFHKTGVGYAYKDDLKVDVTWHGDKNSYFLSGELEHASILLRPSAICKIEKA